MWIFLYFVVLVGICCCCVLHKKCKRGGRDIETDSLPMYRIHRKLS